MEGSECGPRSITQQEFDAPSLAATTVVAGRISRPVTRALGICRYVAEGKTCKYGATCKFSHVIDNALTDSGVGASPPASPGDAERLAMVTTAVASEPADGGATLPSISPDLPSLPPFALGALYPLLEGQQIEFKQSLQHPASVLKMVDTICAFLNSAGGYFIVGVRDDGAVCGVPRSVVDDLLLSVDRLFHERLIINSTTGEALQPSEVHARVEDLGPWGAPSPSAQRARGGTDGAEGATPPRQSPSPATRGGHQQQQRRAKSRGAPPQSPSAAPPPLPPVGQHRFVVVLRVQSATPMHVFSLKSGDRVYRVNASNLTCFGGGVELVQLRDEVRLWARRAGAVLRWGS